MDPAMQERITAAMAKSPYSGDVRFDPSSIIDQFKDWRG
jgi:hypothetical protein